MLVKIFKISEPAVTDFEYFVQNDRSPDEVRAPATIWKWFIDLPKRTEAGSSTPFRTR